jgi:hypothetical protein
MTIYATHRLKVGQQVIRSGETCEIMARIDGPKGPEYRVRSGTSETVVGERAYLRRRAGNARGSATNIRGFSDATYRPHAS